MADDYIPLLSPNMSGGRAYYAIAFDPEGAPLQNAVIWDRLSPEPGP